MREEINYEIGFDDSELIDYYSKKNTLIVKIRAWNDNVLVITFHDMLGMADYGANNISGFVKESQSSPIMERVLGETYEIVPNNPPYYLFQFLNMDETPSFEVIAESLEISKG